MLKVGKVLSMSNQWSEIRGLSEGRKGMEKGMLDRLLDLMIRNKKGYLIIWYPLIIVYCL